jgi:hypothetical protein
MSGRFRPFYVAAIAVVMVGLFGTELVPKSQPVPVQSPSTATVEEEPSWLGPEIKAPTGLLDLTASFSVLPFDIAN